MDINGGLVIDAPNVTVRRSRLRSTFRPIHYTSNATGLVIEDVELDGLGANNTCVGLVYGAVIRRANIHGCENGVNSSGPGLLEDSYVHDLTTANGAHTDGI